MNDTLISKQWQQSLAKYQTLFVGFSGGLDSTVLLHSLVSFPELVGKLQAVHIHHGLSENADVWQSHCEAFCKGLGIPLLTAPVKIEGLANIEESARMARYKVFSSLLATHDCLLLAHHGDDQAETLLLQLLRGAGIDGMAAMLPITPLATGEVIRPFLQYSRQTLEAYAREHALTAIEDESNQNSAFSRNYLRHQIMPLLQEKWPNAARNLARSAMHCQQAKVNLETLATLDCEGLLEPQDTLLLSRPLLTLGRVRLANVLRHWLKKNKIRLPSAIVLERLMDEVIFASPDAMPVVAWGGYVVRRYQQTLYILKESPNAPPHQRIEWTTFPEPLLIPGHCDSPVCVLASQREKGLIVPTGCHIHIAFRQGGELFYWRGQNKQLKKLLQQWHVPPWLRDWVPLLYIDGYLAAVVGFAISDRFYGTDPFHAYGISTSNGVLCPNF